MYGGRYSLTRYSLGAGEGTIEAGAAFSAALKGLAGLFDLFNPGSAIVFPDVAHFLGQCLIHDHRKFQLHFHHLKDTIPKENANRAVSVLTRYYYCDKLKSPDGSR